MVTLKRTCSVAGCENKHLAKGYCNKHYKRVQAYGTPHSASLAERFWARVDKRGPQECWPWTGPLKDSGYGLFYMRGQNAQRRATRVAIFLTTGSWPEDGIQVCHTCDNPACVNPAHLFLGTALENYRDAKAKGRVQPPPVHRGAVNPKSKLTEVDVVEIRRLGRTGMRQVDIAKRFGVGQSCVSSILRRQAWSHLGPRQESPETYARERARILEGHTCD